MGKSSFRTKLVASFFLLAFATIGVFSIVMIRDARREVKEEIRSKVLSIAVAGAQLVDGDLHEQIRNPEDQDSDAYREIEEKLRALRDANRRDDVHVAFIYTMRQVGRNPDRWIYVVDAEEPGEDKSPTGEVMVWEDQGTADDEPLILGEAYAEEEFTRDEYGWWLSGNAPIRDSSGRIVAMVGVDISAQDVIAQTNRIVSIGLLALALALLAAVFLSLLLAGWLTKPIREIVDALKQIGTGHLTLRLPDERKDEIGDINRAINEMAASLTERDALKGALSRYVSQDVVSKLIDKDAFPSLAGLRKKMTILLCDVKNLGKLAEEETPDRLVTILNEYFNSLVEIVFRYQGTIERLNGDGITAIFGAIGADFAQENLAVKAAKRLFEENRRLNQEWGLDGDKAFRLQIGIHTGNAVFGNIGSDHRVEFKVVGESMDIAEAVEELNETYTTSALITESTYEKVSRDFPFIEVGQFQPEGTTRLRLFTIRGMDFREPTA